jgi:hypothetical protein
MNNLYYELAQARIADLHREAAAQRRATVAQAGRRRWRPSLRSLFARSAPEITARRPEASIPAAQASAPAPAGRP